MTIGHIKYREGYKYQLAEDYFCETRIRPPEDIVTDYIILRTNGIMIIKKGYAWDGCSGPTYDDDTNMRGGLGHDAKYQLMRMGLLPQSCRVIADQELREECIQDGMWRIRAWYYFKGVDHFAAYAACYGAEPYPVKTAPKTQ